MDKQTSKKSHERRAETGSRGGRGSSPACNTYTHIHVCILSFLFVLPGEIIGTRWNVNTRNVTHDMSYSRTAAQNKLGTGSGAVSVVIAYQQLPVPTGATRRRRQDATTLPSFLYTTIVWFMG